MPGPLRAVRRFDDQKARWAWLLRVRRSPARRALDAALSASRKAAGFISRLLHGVHLERDGQLAAQSCGPARAAAGERPRPTGKTGVAAVTSVVTSPTIQAVLRNSGPQLPADTDARGGLLLATSGDFSGYQL